MSLHCLLVINLSSSSCYNPWFWPVFLLNLNCFYYFYCIFCCYYCTCVIGHWVLTLLVCVYLCMFTIFDGLFLAMWVSLNVFARKFYSRSHGLRGISVNFVISFVHTKENNWALPVLLPAGLHKVQSCWYCFYSVVQKFLAPQVQGDTLPR